ncbi:MAG: TRAP transporter substrate-binding protein [Beijerinckiaceae bacterium]
MKRMILAAGAAALLSGAAAAQTVTLKLNSGAPPRSYLHSKVFEPWSKAVEADSGGTLKIQRFYGGTLGNFLVTYDRVLDGVADIGFTLAALTGGKFKQQGVAGLPFETKNANEAAVALWNLYEKGVTRAEFNQVQLLGIWAFPNAAIHSKTPIATLADVSGKKLSISSAIGAKIVVGLSATPVTLPPNQAYQAISRGITDGTLMPFTGMQTFKIYEVAKNHLDVALGADTALLFMNKKKYDSLPAKAKAAIDKHSYLPLSKKLADETQKEWERGRNTVGKSVKTLPEAEEAKWQKALAQVSEEWIKSTPDGAKILEAFRAEVKAVRGGK